MSHMHTHLDARRQADLARDPNHAEHHDAVTTAPESRRAYYAARAQWVQLDVPIKPNVRCISADHVRLMLVARNVRPGTRWAAMSNGAATSACQRRQPGGGYYMHTPPLMQPLTAGRMQLLFERVRSHGRSEVLRTWRTSIAVLKVEFSSCVLRASAVKGSAL